MKHYYLILAMLILTFDNTKAQRNYDLKSVTVYPHKVPDTVFGNRRFDVDDYEFYDDTEKMTGTTSKNPDLQCIVGNGFTPFGKSQSPAINEYADGVDTLQFLCDL